MEDMHLDNGEKHSWSLTISNPQKLNQLQLSKVLRPTNDHNKSMYSIRSLFKFKKPMLLLDKVESGEEIKKVCLCYVFGSLPREAHTILALAMNRIEVNLTQEKVVKNGKIHHLKTVIHFSTKQVASGRFE